MKQSNCNDIYGIVHNGEHIDVSRNLTAAKAYATKHGYKDVSVRYNAGYNVAIIASKKGNKWHTL